MLPSPPPTGVGWVYSIAVQADGKVLVGGWGQLSRLNADGSLDMSFNPGTGPNSIVHSIAVQADGKILIGGAFSIFNGTNRNALARLNADGSLDTSFNHGGSGPNAIVNSLAVQADGKILIGGNFNLYNGISRNVFARLHPDGSMDMSFNTGTGAFGQVYSVAVQADGKIFIGGDVLGYNGTTRNRVARINADGTLDTGFNPGTGPNYTVFSIAGQADGKVVIGGDFTSYNGAPRGRIARINSDGSLDTGFNPGIWTGAERKVNSIAVQADGNILIGGEFTSYSGTARSHIIRVFGGEPTITSVIDPISQETNLTIFPNPTSEGYLNIRLSGAKSKKTTLTLMTSLGHKVLEQALVVKEGTGEGQLNTSGLPAGVYLLRITDASGSTVRKIVIQ